MTSLLHIPTQVCFGVGALAALEPPPGRILVLSSQSLSSVALEGMLERLEGDGTEVVLRHKPRGEPSSDEVDLVYGDLPKDLVAVVGIGGGSALDFAKALAILVANGGAIADYEFGQRRIERTVPLYLVPTTCGSGSEVTQYAVINNSKTGRKFTLAHPSLRATSAAVDPLLLSTLPRSLRLATALDAFTHCLEAVLTRNDARMIAPLAEAGLKIGWRRLADGAETEPTNESLADLARLSLYGGLSIAHSRTGLIHTLSVAFAPFCDAPHGLLNARLLPFALAHSLPGYGGLLAALLSRCTGVSVSDDVSALQRLQAWLEGIIGHEPPAPRSTILCRQASIVGRIMQDSGLGDVCHGPTNELALISLVRRIANAAG